MHSWSSSQVLQPGASLYHSVAIAYVWDDLDYGANDSDGTNPAKPAAFVSRTAQSTLDRLFAEHRLTKALEKWPGCRLQRCTEHKRANLLEHCPAHARRELRRDYNRIVYAKNGLDARKAYD